MRILCGPLISEILNIKFYQVPKNLNETYFQPSINLRMCKLQRYQSIPTTCYSNGN